MFRRTVSVAAAPEPTPEPRPLTPAEELEAAEHSVRASKDFCAKLDEEFHDFNRRREAAHRTFTAALKRYVIAQEAVEKINGGGVARPVILATGAIQP